MINEGDKRQSDCNEGARKRGVYDLVKIRFEFAPLLLVWQGEMKTGVKMRISTFVRTKTQRARSEIDGVQVRESVRLMRQKKENARWRQ